MAITINESNKTLYAALTLQADVIELWSWMVWPMTMRVSPAAVSV